MWDTNAVLPLFCLLYLLKCDFNWHGIDDGPSWQNLMDTEDPIEELMVTLVGLQISKFPCTDTPIECELPLLKSEMSCTGLSLEPIFLLLWHLCVMPLAVSKLKKCPSWMRIWLVTEMCKIPLYRAFWFSDQAMVAHLLSLAFAHGGIAQDSTCSPYLVFHS